jgi:hypothetical protein
VEVERQAEVVDLLDHCLHRVLGKGRLAAPVLLPARSARQVWGCKVSSLTLRRAVNCDLHAAKFEPILVLAEGAGRVRGCVRGLIADAVTYNDAPRKILTSKSIVPLRSRPTG